MTSEHMSEEDEDVRAFDEAMLDEGANIPWDQVLAELGWRGN